jgi:cytochrome c biogenesis protein CcmG, thiol:disulfide interchange protein DsbE
VQRPATRLFSAAIAVILVSGALGCGQDAGSDSRLSADQAETPLRDDAPADLKEIRTQANTILGGGVDAFSKRLRELRGTPVVLNIWGSWCGPCRFELPFFQSQAMKRGAEVAFLGVDAIDNEAAAQTFLSETPLPYPSYFDPGDTLASAEIAHSLDAGPGLPNTIFIDSAGNVAYHWRGGYASEQDLSQQIDRYAH